MADDIKTKRAFHEDIFAEDPDKWSWPKASSSGANYTSEVKSDSSCSAGSENGFVFRDSNSPRKGSDNQEDASSSSHPSVILPRERLVPSIYDDDAQSGSPSGVYDKKDLAFRSSFKKGFALAGSRETSPAPSPDSNPPKNGQIDDQNSGLSPGRKDLIVEKPPHSFSEARSSKSREAGPRRRSRSRSKDRRRSPRRDRRRSRDRRNDRERGRHSRVGGRRSRSKESRRRSRSHSRGHRRGHHRSPSRDKYRRRRYSRSRSHSRERSRGSGGRKPGSLSLSSSGGVITPQMALQQTMAAMSAKAQALTGIALPKYYNPAAVNPLKYAEQVQKRKLLWQSKEKVEEQPQPKNSVWDKMTFAQDQDGKMTAKFRKLMGIKAEENKMTEAEEKESVLKKQEELFRNLDQQYEMARMTTHTQRGVGLGYSASSLYPPVSK